MKSDKQGETLPDPPERRDEVEAIPVHDDLVLYDGIEKNGISLNRTARKVWELADGTRTIAAMVDEIAGYLEISDPEVILELENDVRTTLIDFQDNRLLK